MTGLIVFSILAILPSLYLVFWLVIAVKIWGEERAEKKEEEFKSWARNAFGWLVGISLLFKLL